MPSPSAVEKYLAYKKKPKEKLHATSLLMPPTIERFTRIRNFKMLPRSGCETRILRGGPEIEKSVHGIAAALRTVANQKEPWSARHLETFLHGLSGTNSRNLVPSAENAADARRVSAVKAPPIELPVDQKSREGRINDADR